MHIYSSHPIRTIPIEPRPEVAAFYSRADRLTAIAAYGLSILFVVYIAGQFVRAFVNGTL